MSSVAGLLLLPLSLITADAAPYQVALHDAETANQPLVVLVGADWCPGCRTMKHSILPALARRGAFKNVKLTTVDTDREPKLASQLMRGGSIPQLIVFSRQEDGAWKREQITGATSEANVLSLLSRAAAKVPAPSPASSSGAIGN